jgi:hypothetical protein
MYDQLNKEWTLLNQDLRNVQAEIDTHLPLNNNLLRENWQNLLDRERQLRFQYNQYNTEVNLRYKKLVPEGERETLTNEFQRRRAEFLNETRDLRSQVEKIKEHYAELSKDDAVKKALGALRASTKARLDLGPSAEFKKRTAWLINAERDTAPENFTRTPKRKNTLGDRPIKGTPKNKGGAVPASTGPRKPPR